MIANHMKKSKSFLNIQRLIEEDALDMICWIMLSYDARASDMHRMVVHVKAKAQYRGVKKDTFFQDVMLKFDDIYIIKEALDISLRNHPRYFDEVDHLKNVIDLWVAHNKGEISKDTTPNMFYLDAEA